MTPFAVLLALGILTSWIRDPWAWRAIQAALLVWTAVHIARSSARVPPAPPLVGLGLILAWGGLQLVTGATGYAWATRLALLDWLTWAAAFTLAANWWDARAWRWLAAFAGLVAIQAVLQRYTAPDGTIFWCFDSGFRQGLMGPWVSENQYAAFIVLALPSALLLALARGRVSPGWCALAAAMLVSVVVSGSRAGAALTFTLALVVLLRLRIGRKAALLAALVALFTLVTGWELLEHRLRQDKPYRDRALLVSSTLEMIRARPLLGFGFGTWPSAHPAFSTFDDGLHDNHAHNDWLEWTAEGGLPLMLLVLFIALALAGPAWRDLLGLGLLFVLLHCLVEYHFHERPAFGALYFAVAGAVWRTGQTGYFGRQFRASS